jgi:hypothetical protein
MKSNSNRSNGRNGLTRGEVLWVVILIVGIVTLIVVTLGSEVERGNRRMAKDALAHLSSQLYLGLEAEGTISMEELELPFIGPGKIPPRLQVGGRAPLPLADLMLEGTYLPEDPWGHGYVLLEGTSNGREALYLVSAGKDGDLPVLPTAETDLSQRVFLPPPRAN